PPPSPPPTHLSTLSLHDALPISLRRSQPPARTGPKRSVFEQMTIMNTPFVSTRPALSRRAFLRGAGILLSLPLLDAMTPAASRRDRKSTRLNSSHVKISYAVFCL